MRIAGDIGVYRLMVDFGIVVLIWLVQVIIYPSFRFANPNLFTIWHRIYAESLTFVALPLMVGQLAIVGTQIWVYRNWIDMVAGGLIAAGWLWTIRVSIPLHDELARHGLDPDIVRRLVVSNWFRAITWTLVWLLGFATMRTS